MLPRRHGAALSVALAGLTVGCAFHSRAPVAPAPSPAEVRRPPGEVTTASWYGPRFHGRRTASGETFDQEGLSAASPSLPLGTRVRVTNVDNGRAVQLRITDRGPFVRGRGLDVSYGAARRLGMVAHGMSRVRIDVLERPTVRTTVGRTHTRRARGRSSRQPGVSRRVR